MVLHLESEDIDRSLAIFVSYIPHIFSDVKIHHSLGVNCRSRYPAEQTLFAQPLFELLKQSEQGVCHMACYLGSRPSRVTF